ncbi:hypothetical protein HHI36_001888 [Cryptolaemus montrouzieri]|uniref:Uncharacterized protein n=1 Tax=Cryptolaemus montrouzieri TaxID=559131 RepID=A0ABD2P949_9CUCU
MADEKERNICIQIQQWRPLKEWKKNLNGDTEGSTSTIADAQATQSKTPITSRPISYRKRKINDDLSTEVLTTVRDHFKTPREQLDRYDLIGKTNAVRLRGLEKRLASIAEKETNDVLCEAEMGYLRTSPMPHYVSSASHSSTPSPSPSPSTMYNVHVKLVTVQLATHRSNLWTTQQLPPKLPFVMNKISSKLLNIGARDRVTY